MGGNERGMFKENITGRKGEAAFWSTRRRGLNGNGTGLSCGIEQDFKLLEEKEKCI